MNLLKDFKMTVFPVFWSDPFAAIIAIHKDDRLRSGHRREYVLVAEDSGSALEDWAFDGHDFNFGHRLTRRGGFSEGVAHLKLLRELKDFV